MAALMRSARFFTPAVQIPKLLRVIKSGTPQTSTAFALRERHTTDQRSWHSTVAEGVEIPSPAPSKVEKLMDSVERYVQQFGRVSQKQLDPVLSSLNKEGSISVSHSLTLLRLYGSAVFDEPPATRLKLADELWGMFQKQGIPLEVAHYNTLLAVYNMNKFKFSPTDFLAKMEANGITPNRVTYQRLIARFCEEGDIQGATKVLEHMKSSSLPINDQVFNSFITGHLRSNDPDNAKNIVEVMRQAGLEPTSMTYTVLAVGFAERGEVEEVKKFISQAEIENVPLRPGQLLDVYMAFAVSGHSSHLKEVFPFLHNGTPFNQDAIRMCNQLIAAGYEDAAYQLFLEMPKPTRVDADQTTLGRFFLRALAKNKTPVDKVLELVEDMQKKEVNRDDLSAVAQLAYLENQPAYALSVLEKMKAANFPVRTHYFWPAVCQFRDSKNKEGIYEAMEKLIQLTDTKDDFIQTLHSYTIPALVAIGESQADIVSNLQKCGISEKELHFAFFLYLVEQGKLEEAMNALDSHEVTVSLQSFRACLVTQAGRDPDWKQIMQILGKLKSKCDMWRMPGFEATSLALKYNLLAQRKAEWADIQSVFDFMVENDLKILKRNQADIAEYFKGAPAEVMERLDEVTLNYKDDGPAERETSQKTDFLSPDLTIQELRHLAEQKPNNKSIQKRLLIKACAIGDEKEAEKVRSALEAEGFVFPPIVLAQLAYLYATFVKDLDKAQGYLQQLETNFPEHESYRTVILKMAALQAAAGNTDGAVESLQRYAERHQKVVQKQDLKREENYADILTSCQDVDAAKRLMNTLTSLGYLPANNTSLLDSYMDKLLESGDAERILQEFEEIVKTHRRSPRVDKVLQFFIKKEDPDSLQKVVDLSTEVHGLMNVLHHLIADFIECGHVSKARKIMETSGLRANMQRLNYYCQSFIERNMIKELEELVEITKDLFAVDRDNMLFHLIRGYVRQKDLDKAKDVLLQYEEELLQPSARTLRFLARSLQNADQPVPFEVPNFQPVRKEEKVEKKEAKTAKAEPAPSAHRQAASQLKEKIQHGDVDQVLADLQGADKNLLSDAISMIPKPWPTTALTSLFEQLAEKGDLDTLMAIKDDRLPGVLKNSVRSNTFATAVNCGRAEEVIDRLETVSNNSAKYLSLPALDRLHHTAPQLLDRVEAMAKKLHAEKNYTEPLSILWCYYRYHNNPRADQLLKEFPGFDKSVLTGPLCQTAVRENKVDLVESVLKMKQDLGTKQGMAVAYSALLQLYAGQGNVEAVEQTCERITSDGIARSSLRTNPVTIAEALLKENNRPLPAWAVEDSSSSSSSDSSSSGDERQ